MNLPWTPTEKIYIPFYVQCGAQDLVNKGAYNAYEGSKPFAFGKIYFVIALCGNKYFNNQSAFDLHQKENIF